MTQNTEAIIIDTDAGDDIDDAIAIAFAALRPELELLAVTTVLHDTARRAALVRQVLEAAGRRDVLVGAGARGTMRPPEGPRQPEKVTPYRMNHCPPSGDRRDYDDAVSLMARLIEQRPGEVTLIGIGPTTNIGILLCTRPDLISSIKAIALMGGEVELRRGEYNIGCDDIAAQHIFTTGLPIFLGTWNVTRQVVMMPDDCQTVGERGGALGRLLYDCYKVWHPLSAWKPGPVMYDLAPILWRFRPDLFETKPMCIAIEPAGRHTRGWTMETKGEPNADVTVGMNVAEAKRMLMETLLKQAGAPG